MIEKITIENLKLEDSDFCVRSILGKQTILDSKKVFSVYNDNEFPAISVLGNLYNLLNLSNIFGISEKSKNYGYIEIEFTIGDNSENLYKYVQQYMDSVPYFETLAKGNNIIKLNQFGELPSSIGINYTNPGEYIKNRYYILFNSDECQNMMKDFSYMSYLYIPELFKSDLELLKSNKNSVHKKLNIYNRYLEMLGVYKIIDIKSDYYYPTLTLEAFTIRDDYYSLSLFPELENRYPLLSMGSGFFEILHIIDAIEKAKKHKSPLIIKRFCEGLDKDKSDILLNYIKKESGKSIPYSILTVA